MTDNHHHGPGCLCQYCQLQRDFDRADDQLCTTENIIAKAFAAAKIDDCDSIDSGVSIRERDESVMQRFGFRFSVALEADKPHHQLRCLVRIFREIAIELDNAAQREADLVDRRAIS